jgi:TRAP transporter TAXI family solute receptor
VPGLIAVVQSSSGSVATCRAIEKGEVETGFSQSDVAYAAHTGTGSFVGLPPATRLRALASLYPEMIHLVARRDVGITGPSDLRGRRVSLDIAGSGTMVGARLVLAAYKLVESDLALINEPLGTAIDMISAGRLDAFFFIAGWPAPAVSELAAAGKITLVPLAGAEARTLTALHPFFSAATIPATAYPGIDATETIAVEAQWLVSSELQEELVYNLVSALWHPVARTRLEAAKPPEITLGNALAGMVVPLHPGAERYYREKGLLAG